MGSGTLAIIILVAAGALGLWVAITRWKIKTAAVDVAELKKANAELKRTTEHDSAVVEAKEASDEELLDDVSDVLRSRR